MSEKWCSRCGAELPADRGELCRKCVLLLALETEDDATPALADVVDHAVPALGVKLRYFGDFELIGEIARGGMGVVFRAHQISLNRTVAIKLIANDRLTSPEARKRFAIEAEAAANLDHPNIVPIYERGEHEGMPYLCMRLIEGEDLAKHLRSRTGDSSAGQKSHDFCYLMAKVARAVHYAHSRGLLHRDLKPSNILLDKGGEPYVTDFGLAKYVDTERDITRTAAIMGTPHYMSPEQCQGKANQVSVRSDVFSLGIILYEMLAGKTPFTGDSSLEVMQQIVDPDPVKPLKAIDRDLDTICRKALEKEPERRYASALALAEDLDRFEKGMPIQARSSGQVETFVKWAKRNVALACVGAIAIVALVGGSALSLWLAHEARKATKQEQRARLESVANYYVSDMRLAQREIEEGKMMVARERLEKHIPPDGESFDPRGWEWRWLWQETAPDFERVFIGHTLPVSCLEIGQEGQEIVSGSLDGTVRKWNVATGDVTTILTVKDAIHGLDLSSDGRWMAISTWHTVWEPFSGEMTTMVYDLQRPQPVKLELDVRSRWQKSLTRFVETPDKRIQLLIEGEDNDIHHLCLWDFQAPEAVLEQLGEPIEESTVFAASQDGLRLAIANPVPEEDASGLQLLIMNTLTEQSREIVLDGEGEITEMAFSPDGDRLAVLAKRTVDEITHSFVRVVDVPTGEVVLKTPLVKGGHIRPTLIDKQTLLTADSTFALQVWKHDQMNDPQLVPRTRLYGHRSPMRIAASPSGDWLATASDDKSVGLWRMDRKEDRHVSITRNTRSMPVPPSISGDGQIIAANGGIIEDPQQIAVWNNHTGEIQQRIQGLVLHLSPDGRLLRTAHYQTPSKVSGYAGYAGYPYMTINAIEHWDLTQTPAKSRAIIQLDPPLSGVCGGSSSRAAPRDLSSAASMEGLPLSTRTMATSIIFPIMRAFPSPVQVFPLTTATSPSLEERLVSMT